MKTGQPYDCWIPSPSTIAKDVTTIWKAVHRQIADMLEVSDQFSDTEIRGTYRRLQNYDCEVNIETDAWTSPNHLAFVAFIAQI